MHHKIANIILSIILFYAQVSLGCEQPVKFLKKGEVVPCDGYLFSPEKEAEVRVVVQEHKLQGEQLEIQERKIKYLLENEKYWQEIADKEAEKAELWRYRAEDSTEKLVASERGRGTRDWLFLVGGVLITIGAGYSLGQVSK